MTHTDREAAFPSELRQRIEGAIKGLLLLLDELDGDTDMEPALGWGASGLSALDTTVSNDDREQDIADSPHDPEGDDELSLGWNTTEGNMSQGMAILASCEHD